MRRISMLAVACVVAIGCSDRSTTSDSTVGLGSLPGGLSTPSAATTPAGSSAPSVIVLADVLAGIVAGRPTAAPPTDALVDDTGRLRLDVPRTWTDRRTAPAPLAERAVTPYIAAALNQTRFFDGYGEPGLTAVVLDEPPDEALAEYRFDDCAGGAPNGYRAGQLSGEYAAWRDCGETGSAIVTVAVRVGATRGTVLLLAQIVQPADLAALDRALATLRLSS